MEQRIVQDLFHTKALRVSPADAPFWYTSGLFGPYYINTHFLFGSESEAVALLKEIEYWAAEDHRHVFTKEIAVMTKKQYENNACFRNIIDSLVEAARSFDVDFVSGGERRDFFFSIEVARQLNKAHLSIFKDMSAYLSNDLYSEGILVHEQALADKKALHIADLITEASSYIRAWIPAIEYCGAKITSTLAVVDRCQGGIEVLEERGIVARSLVRISKALFSEAKKAELISSEQEAVLLDYAKDTHGFVRRFLAARPDFLEQAASQDAKTAERVLRLRELLNKEQEN